MWTWTQGWGARGASRHLPAAAVGILISACAALPSTPADATPAASKSPAPSMSVSSGTPHPSAAEPPSPVGTPPPAVSGGFERDAMIRTVVRGVALRDGPGLSHARTGVLPEGSRSMVLSDAVEADGYVWQRLAGPGLPPASGCATYPAPELSCPAYRGWAAIGGVEGDAWFELDPSDCPDPASQTRDFMMLGDIEALHCYGSDELEFTAWITIVPEPFRCPVIEHEVAWLACPSSNTALGAADPEEAVTLELFVDPESGSEFDRSGYWGIIIGALDHPAAHQCDDAIPIGHPVVGADAVLDCRARFVVSLHGAVAP